MFQLQNWSTPGTSLSYRPQTVNFAQQPMVSDTVDDFDDPWLQQNRIKKPLVDPVTGKPTMPPQPLTPTTVAGQYNPLNPPSTVPGVAIPPGTNPAKALDILMQTTGMLGSIKKGPTGAFPTIDPKQAALMAGLAKGAVKEGGGLFAGTKDAKKKNEAAIASILSLGSAGLGLGGKGGKKLDPGGNIFKILQGGGKQADASGKKDKGRGEPNKGKPVTLGQGLGILGGGASKPVKGSPTQPKKEEPKKANNKKADDKPKGVLAPAKPAAKPVVASKPVKGSPVQAKKVEPKKDNKKKADNKGKGKKK